jgi:transposase
MGCSKKIKYHKKKKTATYKEADPEKQKAFKEFIKGIDPKLLVYLDESGVNKWLYREYGRAPSGTKVPDKISGLRYERESFIAAQVQNRIIAPMVFRGTCNTQTFNTWLSKVLIPQLKPGQIIIMDNASFHKSSKTRELIQSAGCKLLYLPPYSPELNPIEKTWANIKYKIRNFLDIDQNLYSAINRVFQSLNV